MIVMMNIEGMEGKRLGEMTPSDAARVFAETYWAESRQVINLELVPGSVLSVDFQVSDGSAYYRAWWNGECYLIYRLGD